MCYEAHIRLSFFMVSIYIILAWVSMSIVLTQVVVPSFQDVAMLIKLFILHEHNNLQNKKKSHQLQDEEKMCVKEGRGKWKCLESDCTSLKEGLLCHWSL